MTFRYLCLCCGRKFVAEGVIPLSADGKHIIGDEDSVQLWKRKVKSYELINGWCYATLEEIGLLEAR